MRRNTDACCTFRRGQQRLSPEEAARYLLRRAVSWGRSSSVFFVNECGLSLSGGSHPEYATPECDNVLDLVAHDKAGERIPQGLLTSDLPTTARARDRRGTQPVLQNNTDSADHSMPDPRPALRLYDELGVLVAARVDEASGYRYCSDGEAQRRNFLPDAAPARIAACRHHPWRRKITGASLRGALGAGR